MEINLAAQRKKHLERLHATGSPHKALILILSPRGPFGNHSVFQSKCYFSSLLWRFNWLNLLWSYTANLPSHCTLWDPEKRRWMPYFFLFPVCHPGPHPQMVFGKQQDKVSERRVPLGDSGKLFHAPATAPGVFFTSSSYLSCGRQDFYVKTHLRYPPKSWATTAEQKNITSSRLLAVPHILSGVWCEHFYPYRRWRRSQKIAVIKFWVQKKKNPITRIRRFCKPTRVKIVINAASSCFSLGSIFTTLWLGSGLVPAQKPLGKSLKMIKFCSRMPVLAATNSTEISIHSITIRVEANS